MSKRMKIVFTVSVVLNVLLIGIIVGHMVRQFHQAPWQSAHLSDDSRALMRESFKEVLPLKQEMFKKKREVHALLSEEVFDELVYDRLNAELVALKQDFEKRKGTALKAVMMKLSPEERKAFAAHMADRIDGRMKKHRSWAGTGRDHKEKHRE